MAFHTYPSNDILSSYTTSILTTALTILALPTVLVIWSAQSLAPNRTKAQAISLPYLVRYISTMKSLWLPYGSSIVRLCQRLGIASEDSTRIYSHGWEANERAQSHADYGDTLLVVHPAGIQLCVSDSKLFYEILARKQNLGGIWNDAEWQAHRKMTTVTLPKMTLTKEETLSNFFVYVFVGNDTTAIALTNLLTHLTANPDTTDWIVQEINDYLPPDASSKTWDYDTYFKIKRCRAVSFETLRICHPLSQFVKITGVHEQTLEIDSQTYFLPPHTTIHCSIPALHAHPKYWASNPLVWSPSRLISVPSTDITARKHSTKTFDEEKVEADTSAHFMPFTWGQRVFPRRKFAQVELVAVLAALFKEWKVEVVPKEGETAEQAENRDWKSSLVVGHETYVA